MAGGTSAAGQLVVLIPASNEAQWIDGCLAALLASEPPPVPVRVVVVANACSDDTAPRARAHAAEFTARGWRLDVLERAEAGKPGALNAAEAALPAGGIRVYLDADVRLSPPLLAQIAAALAGTAPAYASGTPRLAPARSRFSRAYGRFWQRLPFVARDVPGFGLYAVNAAARARWGAFPEIISDDGFVRLQFRPAERQRLAARYDWPLAEGFSRLVRVRRRQDAGVAELAARFPQLLANQGAPRPGAALVARLALADPAGFAAYALVALAVRLTRGRHAGRWMRGR